MSHHPAVDGPGAVLFSLLTVLRLGEGVRRCRFEDPELETGGLERRVRKGGSQTGVAEGAAVWGLGSEGGEALFEVSAPGLA
ncbi:hypothetical protein ColKHC_09071 [Colletotrichum higginsianum]|nr:hypothetical protein ColKHC_09071 [Colletotrichum higginsianum]